MINWKSNVFPGILGRTCDRPCEPACRRGRVEEGQEGMCSGRDLPPEARRRRLQGRRQFHRMPKAPEKNGKRIACIGGGPASLTVARDLAPLGYEIVSSTADPKPAASCARRSRASACPRR
jgi:formate dehydrogenase beta subunit